MNSTPIKVVLNDKEGMMFEIPSSSRKDVTFITNVFYDSRGWWCSCEDYYFRHHKQKNYECKHIKTAKAIMSDYNE